MKPPAMKLSAVKPPTANLAPWQNSPAQPCGRFSILRLPVRWIAFLVMNAACVTAIAAALQQSDQDSLFNQAVQAYQQNQFKTAQEQFQRVGGSHAQEAQRYVGKIKTYLEAWSAATTVLRRSADEQDARSLAFAIEELQVAISIKPDGPGHPEQQLAKAQQLKQQVERAHSNKNKEAERSLCDRSLAAATEHRFKEASELSCLLADDDPAYSCGGNEAVYVCHLNTELAKIDKAGTVTSSGSTPGSARGSNQNASTQTAPTPNKSPAQSPLTSLDKGKAAYEHNDFDRARSLFHNVSGDSKPAADEFLDKISRYTDSLSNAEKLRREGNYEEARAAFLSAANIKPDGPGNPQHRASLMDLFLGLDKFYSGDYVSAIQHLQACDQSNTGKPDLVHFYLGASKLALFFVTGGDDSALHQDALNELRLAKQAGFKTTGQDVSPKILQAYDQL
jgi:tetratricopeptide (TPR) repeat protein